MVFIPMKTVPFDDAVYPRPYMKILWASTTSEREDGMDDIEQRMIAAHQRGMADATEYFAGIASAVMAQFASRDEQDSYIAGLVAGYLAIRKKA
jgi:hypothetical protein